ncbi:9380_t:CDS:2, partial [Acaulospora morrowiae]
GTTLREFILTSVAFTALRSMESETVTRPLLNSEPSNRSSATSLVRANEKALSTWDMIKLTICMAGLQFTCDYGTPYLRNLGLSSELISLVWLAGPLSGLLIQPLVGAFSDKSTSRMGRRRPYIIIGGILVCLSMAGIAYSIELATFLLGKKKLLNGFGDDDEVRKVAILVAVFSFYCLDFSLNAVQASCRALILDIPPLYQQETSNAWAGRMLHVGNVIGYFTGFLDLKTLFSWLGDSQVKILCIISCIVFSISLFVTSISVKETVYVPVAEDSKYAC